MIFRLALNNNETSSVTKKLRDFYDKWHLRRIGCAEDERVFYEKILRLAKMIKHGSKILDIGCGQAIALMVAKNHGLVPYGLDISREALKIGKRNISDSDLLLAAGENLPWIDECFDFVACLGSLEHFSNKEQAISEMARVLKTKGLACILVPNVYFIGYVYFAWKYGLPPDQTNQTLSESFATKSEWESLLNTSFEVISVRGCNSPMKRSKKVHPVIKFFYDYFLRFLLPLNLSDQFIFICRKRTLNFHSLGIVKKEPKFILC